MMTNWSNFFEMIFLHKWKKNSATHELNHPPSFCRFMCTDWTRGFMKTQGQNVCRTNTPPPTHPSQPPDRVSKAFLLCAKIVKKNLQHVIPSFSCLNRALSVFSMSSLSVFSFSLPFKNMLPRRKRRRSFPLWKIWFEPSEQTTNLRPSRTVKRSVHSKRDRGDKGMLKRQLKEKQSGF